MEGDLALQAVVEALGGQGTRSHILSAAAEVFADLGLEGARVDEIARRASVPKATLYYHFKGKEDLYEQVLETLMDAVAQAAARALEGEKDPLAFARKVFESVFLISAQSEKVMRILIRECANGGRVLERIKQRRADLFVPLFRSVTGPIKEGIDRGDLRAIDPEKTILSSMGLVVLFFAARPLLSLFYEDEGGLDEWKDFFDQVLVHQLSPGGKA